MGSLATTPGAGGLRPGLPLAGAAPGNRSRPSCPFALNFGADGHSLRQIRQRAHRQPRLHIGQADSDRSAGQPAAKATGTETYPQSQDHIRVKRRTSRCLSLVPRRLAHSRPTPGHSTTAPAAMGAKGAMLGPSSVAPARQEGRQSRATGQAPQSLQHGKRGYHAAGAPSCDHQSPHRPPRALFRDTLSSRPTATIDVARRTTS